jgi:hypothetical protein
MPWKLVSGCSPSECWLWNISQLTIANGQVASDSLSHLRPCENLRNIKSLLLVWIFSFFFILGFHYDDPYINTMNIDHLPPITFLSPSPTATTNSPPSTFISFFFKYRFHIREKQCRICLSQTGLLFSKLRI